MSLKKSGEMELDVQEGIAEDSQAAGWQSDIEVLGERRGTRIHDTRRNAKTYGFIWYLESGERIVTGSGNRKSRRREWERAGVDREEGTGNKARGRDRGGGKLEDLVLVKYVNQHQLRPDLMMYTNVI
ncbi:hypothetical protein PM082_018092 [Marasmius tenuissimus]|nr:hypothetical protein PM082_018092 [Marasmius tenuissimus]